MICPLWSCLKHAVRLSLSISTYKARSWINIRLAKIDEFNKKITLNNRSIKEWVVKLQFEYV